MIILKLGGSIITKKDQDKPEINRKTLKRLSKEIAQSLTQNDLQLVIVHGAGPYGHVPAKKYALTQGLKSPKQIMGAAITHQAMEELNQQVVSALISEGVNAMAYQPSAGGVLEDRRLVSFPLASLEMMVSLGIVPVLYGDVLPDLKTGVNILSGDQLVPYLAQKLSAERVIITTSHNGIYDRDPDAKGAKKIDTIDATTVSALSSRTTKGTDVTGGIAGKVRELMTIARQGIKTEIISGNEPGYLKRALDGESGIGTTIL